MNQEEGILLKKPTSMWTKPVKIKVQLFKSIFKLFKDAALKNWLKIPSNFIDTISGLELKTGIGERGWLLVTRTLMDAMFRLVEEHKESINVESVVYDHLDKQLNEILEYRNHYIGFDFFENPKKMKLLEVTQPVYCEFLQCVGFEPQIAQNICARLAGYFVLSLMNEWRKNPDYYQPLEKSIKTRFDKAGKKEIEWMHYLAWIKKLVEEPVFSETFSLKQVYVPLRGYYKKKKRIDNFDEGDRYKDRTEVDQYKKIVIDLERELTKWLETADKDDALRIIAGGPGYGKSSFLKIFAEELAKKNMWVLFIPLHRFEIKDDLKDALKDFIGYNDYLFHDPIGDERLVIIFDGLDELAMQGEVLADAASHFIREIKMKLMNFNSQEIRLQVLISGRDIIIQANEFEFRKDKQVLYILPYYIKEDKGKEYLDSNGILKEDQRNTWWRNYGELKGYMYKGLPEELKNEDLDKLTAQPLLNYLVALSFERGKIRFSERTNLNEIYNDLLDAVHKRSYEESRVHKSVERLDYNLFVRILEEIAVSAWHGDVRKTTVAEIEKHCKSSGLDDKILNTFKLCAKEGLVSFMAAFYFHKAGLDSYGEETFEFTHKSFGEFLAATRIVKKIKQIHKNRVKREKNYEEGWSVKECLKEWINVFGPKELDGDLLKFISNEIIAIYEKNKKDLKDIQETTINVINYMLKHGMPMESLNGTRQSYPIENTQALNSQKALLIILSTISSYTGEISRIVWPSYTAFGELISRLHGQRTGPEHFMSEFYNNLDLENAILLVKDFLGANFKGTNLSQAKLAFCNLRIACFMRANLRGTDLGGTNLVGADLREADLNRADLRGADLREADLREAYLGEAYLWKADLRETDLRGTDFSGADLRRVNLSETDLREANLMGADLKEADLRGAKIKKKQLKLAIVDETTKLP